MELLAGYSIAKEEFINQFLSSLVINVIRERVEVGLMEGI
jgi:hypothetical protein